MEFIDKYNVIKAYDISNVYLPGFILIPCDKYGVQIYYDCDMIYYSKGKVLSYPSNKPLRKIKNLSAYYKVYKEDGKDKELIRIVTNFIYREYKESMRGNEFNEEFTPEEFEIYKEAYEKEWDNAIYKRAFSFDELKEKGSIKTELPNLFDE
ncbi:hypothetical protein HOR18_gp183 [Staphylococcus phage vB_SscM-1]|uniref:Uncharacterized protein n=2 Tax=Sciuriunavirus SscM1 TaxID=2734053 RepID=A0A1X9IA00_9CAUD|nr:hypothetical protein HOR18_gp183 [Staphylococcus phage vB_SscM-1]ANT44846.1 hypothetical protein vB_SscM-1_182 [Staphylococcus phage vB_SscM-1]ANT45048.1 hypothetical protein vB_SscM-2_181 [Staphylococcus phage vB_SscM-2]